MGEVDIVARRRNTLIFVEVKARLTHDGAAEAVMVRRQRRVVAAAEAWLAAHPDDINCDIRFDCVLVAPKSLRVTSWRRSTRATRVPLSMLLLRLSANAFREGIGPDFGGTLRSFEPIA